MKEDKLKEGLKYDAGKLRYDLLPPEALEEVVKVFTHGAQKYESRNWEKGMNWGRVYGALMRHIQAFWRGKNVNEEDFGLLHLAHVAWCALVLLHYQLKEDKYKKFDDRPNTVYDKQRDKEYYSEEAIRARLNVAFEKQIKEDMRVA